MARKCIEFSRRKADVDPEICTPIRLADGQDWLIRRAWWEIHPIFKGGRPVGYTEQTSCGDELDPLVESIADESMDPVQKIQAIQLLGAILLRQSYDLDQAELEKLLVYRAGDPASEAMIAAIVEAATGAKPVNPRPTKAPINE